MERCEHCGDVLWGWDTTELSVLKGLCKYCYEQDNGKGDDDR